MLSLKKAIAAIEKHGALLVFPIDNAREPASLWYDFFPRSKMRWEWDDDGDNRVADLWHLRAKLSGSGKVVYSKWYRGRATCFSREFFTWFLAASQGHETSLSRQARELLDILEDNSPQSTKALKKASDLRGRDNEAVYTRAFKELWERGLIVGFGEVDDGAFPSLAVGASKLIFEDLWQAALKLDPADADARIRARLGAKSPFLKFYDRAKGAKISRSSALV